ncbi:glutamate synthase-related protein [Salipiger mangrovisoli]|uniref:glutamate synthase-related protein n=1 Tax=Salipiger mangrovisoli TaxID=2865933 RepID=UPI001F11A1FE|nr:glutamate synthase-related protein [Salipiger mangrovisoli]
MAGHQRCILECIRPEMRQNFFEDQDKKASSHEERTLIYQRTRNIDRARPFGTRESVDFELCLGQRRELVRPVKAIVATGITPDFIVIGGKEGSTGAAPLEVANSLGMPLIEGLAFVHNALRDAGLRDRIRLGASGKAMALGADWGKFRARLHVRSGVHPIAVLPHQPLTEIPGAAELDHPGEVRPHHLRLREKNRNVIVGNQS